MQQAGGAIEDPGAAGRTPADVSALLVELGRAFKGWSFYPEGHPARHELLDRAWRAFSGELRRGGPLALEIRRGAFWMPGAEAPMATRADDTARQLFVRSVRRVVFDSALDAPTLSAFLDVLVTDAEALEGAGGFESVFYAGPRRGVHVNEANWHALLERSERAAAQAAEAAPPEAPLGEEQLAFEEHGDSPGLPLAALLGAAVQQAAGPPPVPVDPAAERARELGGLLEQLEECDDDLGYRELARHLGTLATQVSSDDGNLDGVFRALVLLARHASDDAKRSYAQRETAIQFLAHLAQGAVLEHLIERAVAPEVGPSVDATAVLRELGARAAPLLLDRLEGEADAERRGRLAGVLIALGEEACPTLSEAIVAGSPRRLRVALRLAGETQNPRLVPSLREALLAGEGEVAREAAQALVRVGDVLALESLAEALRSPRPAVVSLAAYSLGTTGRVLALAPLYDVLARALAGGQLPLAREVVRGLGRLGRAEAAPVLVSILARGGLFRRKQLRELKLAAVSALAQLPGREAEQALVRAARGTDGRLREAAQTALRRRAQEIEPRRGGPSS
jgi:HEAT repeat protein